MFCHCIYFPVSQDVHKIIKRKIRLIVETVEVIFKNKLCICQLRTHTIFQFLQLFHFYTFLHNSYVKPKQMFSENFNLYILSYCITFSLWYNYIFFVIKNGFLKCFKVIVGGGGMAEAPLAPSPSRYATRLQRFWIKTCCFRIKFDVWTFMVVVCDCVTLCLKGFPWERGRIANPWKVECNFLLFFTYI